MTPLQEGIALALASGSTIQDAAKSLDVGERTVKEWLKQTAFVERILELRSEMTERALGRLLDGMTRAADTLRSLCSCSRSEQVRLGAARALIELATKLRESTEFERRIAALERAERENGHVVEPAA